MLAAAAGVLAFSAAAFARGGDGMPEPEKTSDLVITWPLLYTLAFVAATCVLGFKNSKRAQMD